MGQDLRCLDERSRNKQVHEKVSRSEKQAMKELRDNKDLLGKIADKGRAMVVLNGSLCYK